jgi:hypothetical protein
MVSGMAGEYEELVLRDKNQLFQSFRRQLRPLLPR